MTTPGGSVGPTPIRKDTALPADASIRQGSYLRSSVSALFLDATAQVLTSLARLTVLALFVITFLLQPSQIPSSSMEPTMLVGDFVLVNKQVFAPAGHWRWLLPYREPRRDDIVVFHYPVDPSELLVKRVIAVPGDRVHLHRGAVVLNGSPMTEPFTRYDAVEPSLFRDEFPTLERADPAVEAPWWIELRRRMRRGELPVPSGRYFAMGDNRNNSQDSRFWGFVPRGSIVGEPLLVYLSVDRTAGTPRGRLRLGRSLHVVR
jgi:signal peptidase I